MKKGRTMGGQVAAALWIVGCGAFVALSAPAQQAPVTPAPSGVTSATNAADEVIGRQLAMLLDAVEATDDQGKPMVDPSYRQNTTRSLTRLQRTIESKDFRNALQACDNITSDPVSPSFRKMLKELYAAISFQVKAEQTRLASDMRAVLASVPAACAAATNQADLQALSAQVQQAQNTLSRMSDNENPEVSILRQNLQNGQELIRMSMGCLAAEAAGDLSKALESMNQIMSMSSYSSFTSNPEMRKKLDRLQSAVADESSKVIKAAREGLAKATTSREVYALSLDFNRQCSRQQRYSNNDPIVQQDLESTRNALGAWVRVLSAEERGDIQSALQTLQTLDSDYYGRSDAQLQSLLALKRSALVLKLLNQPSAPDDAAIKVVNDLMATADSLDKLIELRRRLARISPFAVVRMGYSTAQPEVQALVADIQTLEVWRDALETKQYGIFFQRQSELGLLSYLNPYGAGSSSHRWKAVVSRYQNQMRAKALAEMFDLKGFEVKDGQTPEQALLQMADKATADKQWESVAVPLDAYRLAAFGNRTTPAALTDEINACRNFIAARNYEKAGDIARAAASYLAVLGAPAKRAPVEEAFGEVARLRKDHPDLFEKARNAPAATAATAAATP